MVLVFSYLRCWWGAEAPLVSRAFKMILRLITGVGRDYFTLVAQKKGETLRYVTSQTEIIVLLACFKQMLLFSVLW